MVKTSFLWANVLGSRSFIDHKTTDEEDILILNFAGISKEQLQKNLKITANTKDKIIEFIWDPKEEEIEDILPAFSSFVMFPEIQYIDTSKIYTSYKNGLLYIHLPYKQKTTVSINIE